MKKIFFLVFSFLVFSLYAQDLQLVLPKTVFTGDYVEMQYIFQSQEKLLKGENSSQHLDLSTDFPVFKKISELCLVTQASLDYTQGFSGPSYSLSIRLIPWKPGTIDFPSFDLGMLVKKSTEGSQGNFSYTVDFSPFDVHSLSAQENISQFRSHMAPMLIPGTRVYLVVVFFIVALIFFLLIFTLTRIPAISRYIRELKDTRYLRRTTRVTVRNLERLRAGAAKMDDNRFAMNIQKIIREFIESRFDFDFHSVVTSEIAIVFDEKFGDLLTELASESVQTLQAIFLRTDYIRFAHGQADSTFHSDERSLMINEAIKMVKNFDFDPEDCQEDSQ